MKKNFKKIILGLIVFILFFVPLLSFAQTKWENRMKNVLSPDVPILNIKGEEFEATIFRIIQYILTFLGVVAVLVIIYGGFLWMTAAGNEEKVGKAKKTLQRGLVGLVIILLAYAIAMFVIKQLGELK